MITATARGGTPLPAARSQQVFRTILDALARPGTVRRLSADPGDGQLAGLPAALLPLLALADLSTPACVLADGSDDTGWAGLVRTMTSAPAAALTQARLVAALRPVTDGELASLRTGTAAAPEDGALACLSVACLRALPDGEDQDGGDQDGGDQDGGDQDGGDQDGGDQVSGAGDRVLRLSGPGIPGIRRLVVNGLPPGFTAARRGLTGAFPAGADLLLITPGGGIAGLPRTTLIDEGTG